MKPELTSELYKEIYHMLSSNPEFMKAVVEVVYWGFMMQPVRKLEIVGGTDV